MLSNPKKYYYSILPPPLPSQSRVRGSSYFRPAKPRLPTDIVDDEVIWERQFPNHGGILNGRMRVNCFLCMLSEAEREE